VEEKTPWKVIPEIVSKLETQVENEYTRKKSKLFEIWTQFEHCLFSKKNCYIKMELILRIHFIILYS
jgi:hypothetical protein